MRYLAILLITLMVTACSTTPAKHGEPSVMTPAHTSESARNSAAPDSVVEFLLTSAASDFRTHGPAGALRFRKVQLGHVKTADGSERYFLCGEFLPAAVDGKEKWAPFATIKTSGYEQWLGGYPLCENDAVVWDKVEDLATALQTRFDSTHQRPQ